MMISRFEGIFRQTQIAKRQLFPLHGPLYLHVDTLPGLGSSQETGLTCRALAYLSDSQAAKGCHKHRTSSTAQGGGGSFKNRKPIGDVGCCESGMAERSHWLTERWLELCLLEWLQWLQWSPLPHLLDVVWCTATVVVVVA